MKVKTLIVGELQENCYCLFNEEKEALVIDPGAESEKIINALKGYDVKGILITHFHFDHIGAKAALEQKFNLKANQPLPNHFHYQIIKNPGHTLDSQSFYFPKEKMLFDGDFVFAGAIGRTDLGGNNFQMKKSLQMISQYPDDLILYPGHGKPTSLKNEKPTIAYYLQIL